MKKILSTICLLLLLWLPVLSASEKCVIRIENPTKQTVAKFQNGSYDVASYHPGKYIDLVVTESEKSQLSRDYAFTVTQTEAGVKANLNSTKTINGYRTYDVLLAELQQMVSQHPNILKLYNLGNSTGKNYSAAGIAAYNNFQHDIWAIKLSDNVSVEEDEPSFYFMGEHHAREPISLEMNLKILHELVDNYGTNTAMTNRVNNSQIWFIPLVNPNGHKVVLDQTDVWWRKNIRDNNNNQQIDGNGGGTDASVDGVDLNRNYDFAWGTTGTSTQFDNHTYCGPAPFSEVELQAVKTLMAKHKFVAGISYHTYSELVLYPFGYESGVYAPDRLALKALAEEMAATIPKVNGGTYTPQSSWELYPCSGTTDDYSYGNYGTFSYTIEMATEFIPPQAEIQAIIQNNLQASMLLLDRINKSTLTGIVKDSQSGLPVRAEIRVEEIDNGGIYRAPYTSDSTYGRYYRLLPTGNYTVFISAYGYEPKSFSNVEISNSSVTSLNVQLNPLTTWPISGTVSKLSTGNPVNNAKIEVLNTPLQPIYTGNNGFYQINQIYPGAYQVKISAADCATMIASIDIGTTGSGSVYNFALLDPEPAWETLYSQDFEGSTFPPAGWTNSTPGWEVGTESHSGDKCAGAAYQPAGTRTLTSQAVTNYSNYDSLRVNFWWKDDDISKISGHDTTWCEYTVGNSTSWQKLATLSKASSDGSYKQCFGYLPQGLTQPLKFRWRDKTNGSYSAYGTGIDDILIEKKYRTDISDEASITKDFSVAQNYPNPFNPTTTIAYNLQTKANIALLVYNAKGEMVKSLVKGVQNAGNHSVSFDGSSLNSGIYFYKLAVNGNSVINKMILLK